MTSFPVGFIVHLGGVVSAKSVKLLDKIHNPGEKNSIISILELSVELLDKIHNPGKKLVKFV